ncbi:N-acetylmuramoyl-L-alanine amidase [uncultured Tenacibaculum sp.]|uniref:N-acetylmuramoyl-L-alanine amidase family protein n=1 Tax=uncultured Tenacibaculum sp. TaxID=174713 RepID=UPI0026117FF3|nr:N-acetylmuramoyl-L-alanine amidase [uncultured Tenacibaculum sp.]
MRAPHKLIGALFLIGMLSTLNAQRDVASDQNPIVIIDPGHGGADAGAISRTGSKEKDITLSVAYKMLVLNNRLNKKPVELYLTRYIDTLISLNDRTQLAKKLKADVFISIHCNQAINQTAAGTEVYIHPKSEVQAEESAYFGFIIQKGLSDILGIKSRGIKYGNFQVLRDSEADCATVLLELGFLSQNDEAVYLTKEESHRAIAFLLLQSITKFLEL